MQLTEPLFIALQCVGNSDLKFLKASAWENEAVGAVTATGDENSQFIIYDVGANEFEFCHIHESYFYWT